MSRDREVLVAGSSAPITFQSLAEKTILPYLQNHIKILIGLKKKNLHVLTCPTYGGSDAKLVLVSLCTFPVLFGDGLPFKHLRNKALTVLEKKIYSKSL